MTSSENCAAGEYAAYVRADGSLVCVRAEPRNPPPEFNPAGAIVAVMLVLAMVLFLLARKKEAR